MGENIKNHIKKYELPTNHEEQNNVTNKLNEIISLSISIEREVDLIKEKLYGPNPCEVKNDFEILGINGRIELLETNFEQTLKELILIRESL